MKRISIVNIKGGDGKSTVCNTLPRALHHFHGKTSLIADFDNQLSATESYVDIDQFEFEHTTFTALNNGIAPEPIKVNDGLSIIPADLRLTELDQQDFGLLTRARKMLRSIGGFDYAFFDTPGHEGNRVAAVLSASDAIIIPISLTPLSRKALDHTVQIVQDVIEGPNPQLQILGVVPMAVNSPVNGLPTVKEELEVFNELMEGFGDLMLPFLANRPSIYPKTQSERLGVTELPENPGKKKAVAELKLLTEEVKNRLEAI